MIIMVLITLQGKILNKIIKSLINSVLHLVLKKISKVIRMIFRKKKNKFRIIIKMLFKMTFLALDKIKIQINNSKHIVINFRIIFLEMIIIKILVLELNKKLKKIK